MYSNIVMAFIEPRIVFLLAINAYCENDYCIYKYLIERYAFLESLESEIISNLLLEEIKNYYDKSAFGTNEFFLNNPQ